VFDEKRQRYDLNIPCFKNCMEQSLFSVKQANMSVIDFNLGAKVQYSEFDDQRL
jgi:hypothetical protein